MRLWIIVALLALTVGVLTDVKHELKGIRHNLETQLRAK